MENFRILVLIQDGQWHIMVCIYVLCFSNWKGRENEKTTNHLK